MLPAPDDCYRALAARDPRFDGFFFTGVTSTGVFCRPICPARTPRRERCRFFTLAAEASRAGFRPCLRCRPELAPGLAPVDAAPRLVQRALARVEAGALNEGSVEGLARGLGVSGRHLRRAMERELGLPPVELAQTRRLLLAKQLLTETALPMVDVAFAAGFRSVRRFNALFRARCRLEPTALRRSAGEAPGAALRLRLAYRPPLAWEPLLGFLAARAVPGVEAVEEGRYLRTVALQGRRGWVRAGPPARGALPVELAPELLPVLQPLLARLRALFDLDAHPQAVADALGHDEALRVRLAKVPGLRVPGALDGFELAVRALLGQQVSVRAATTLAGRLAGALGEPVVTPFPALARAFPSARTLARARPEALSALGILPARARALVGLAHEVEAGLLLEPSVDVAASLARLEALPGVGPWTSHYVAMRALRWPDAFPHGDLALRKALGLDARALLARSAAWRPWRAYAALALWTA